MKKSLLIVGHFGGHNTGDEAMLAGLLDALPETVVQSSAVVRKDAAAPPWLASKGVKVIGPSLRELLPLVGSCRTLVLCGGTHFHDDYSPLRLWRHRLYMARLAGISVMARTLGKRVAWIGMGFGPIRYASTRRLLDWGLRSCDAVTVRDAPSLAECSHMKRRYAAKIGFDLAACMQAASTPRVSSPQMPKFRIGVSLMSLANSRTGGAEVDLKVRNALEEALSSLLDRHTDWAVDVIAIRGGERESDVFVSSELAEHLRTVAGDRVRVVPYTDNPYLMRSHIEACDILVATRYHAGVLGYLTARPLQLIAYHRKVVDLTKEIELPTHAWVNPANVTAALFSDRIEEMRRKPSKFIARRAIADARRSAYMHANALLGRTRDQSAVGRLNVDADPR